MRARNRVGFHKFLLPSTIRSALRKDYLARQRRHGPTAPYPAWTRPYNKTLQRMKTL